MKKIIKYSLALTIWCLVLGLMVHFSPVLQTKQVRAETLLEQVGSGGLNAVGSDAYGTTDGAAPKDIRVMIASVIYVALGFLGIVFVVLLVWAGFTWMTAGGEEAKIGEAKKRITAGVIGLVIVLAAWGTTWFVMNTLVLATTGTALTPLP